MNASQTDSETARELERLGKLPWFSPGKPCRTDIFHERDFQTEQEPCGENGVRRVSARCAK